MGGLQAAGTRVPVRRERYTQPEGASNHFHDKADNLAERQKKSPVVIMARVTELSYLRSFSRPTLQLSSGEITSKGGKVIVAKGAKSHIPITTSRDLTAGAC
jgi:hypothetical protein